MFALCLVKRYKNCNYIQLFGGLDVVVEKNEAVGLPPDDGAVLVTYKNGKVSKTRKVHDDEHVASLNALFEMAKLSGYTIIKPDGTVL